MAKSVQLSSPFVPDLGTQDATEAPSSENAVAFLTEDKQDSYVPQSSLTQPEDRLHPAWGRTWSAPLGEYVPTFPAYPDPHVPADQGAIATFVNGMPVILFNPMTLRMMDPLLVDFLLAHEDAHHSRGHLLASQFTDTPYNAVWMSRARELDADCESAKVMSQLHPDSETRLLSLIRTHSTNDLSHPSGTERAAKVAACWDASTSAVHDSEDSPSEINEDSTPVKEPKRPATPSHAVAVTDLTASFLKQLVDESTTHFENIQGLQVPKNSQYFATDLILDNSRDTWVSVTKTGGRYVTRLQQSAKDPVENKRLHELYANQIGKTLGAEWGRVDISQYGNDRTAVFVRAKDDTTIEVISTCETNSDECSVSLFAQSYEPNFKNEDAAEKVSAKKEELKAKSLPQIKFIVLPKR
jgi:hypothetical protein